MIVASTFSSVEASGTKQQWDAKKKKHCNVPYPDMVDGYNVSMGGDNLNDMLISLYQVDIQTRKQWYLKIIMHPIIISNVNGWLLHIRYMKQLANPNKNQLTLLQFTKGVAGALLLAGKAPIKAPGRPKKRSLLPMPTVGKKLMVAKPIADVRYDGTHHWSDFEKKSNNCGKCPMHFLFQKDWNCFKQFHN